MKFGVIYARYSSHSQNEQTIETQIQYCENYAKEHGITIVGKYIDKAITGTKDKRKDFMRLIRDCKKQRPKFDYVICYKFDRYARNLNDDVKYREIFAENDVEVISVMETLPKTASGRMMRNMLAVINSFYSDNLSENIVGGMAKNAEKHLTTGSLPLGFKAMNKEIVIDEENAEVVKYIFESYANDKTITEIADYLNSKGYKTSQGNKFNKNSFHTILTNKRYLGIYTFKGNEEPNILPRIIDNELFYKVQEKLKKNKKAPARSRAGDEVEYILTGILKCGKCKKMMTAYGGTSKTGKIHRYYKCNGAKNRSCDKKPVRKEWIENLVVDECRKILTDENIRLIAKEVVEATAIGNVEVIKDLQKQLSRAEKIKKNLFDTLKLCEDDETRKEILAEMTKENAHIDELKLQIERESIFTYEITETEVMFFLSQLQKGNINDIQYRRLLVNVFVNEIYLYDDKLKIFFNTSNIPAEITVDLVDEIGEIEGVQGCSTMTKTAPPKHCTTALLCGCIFYGITIIGIIQFI